MSISTKHHDVINVEVVRQLLHHNQEEQLLTGLYQKLQGISCPEHGTLPQLQLIPEPGGYSVDLVNDCCPAFTDMCSAKIQ
ncbi:hypothetical protein HMJ29_18035 [Hymenobacter taeanensis]|uniref:Uncharacterized protein n=1 Tax=Hymenobacter taeanensis TaxID=2735321 RepID=A0A6M6BNW5_9BACT|nr:MULTISPECIES: hypothetical protein [Hymenobacter]QJX48715.1 hypothetical protein HMJ29_18035 [Hymenobacter taeanensis]UOQ81785.1 hypothetical protein MUN83_03060 [Hymenobacter sp. 5414T-23]